MFLQSAKIRVGALKGFRGYIYELGGDPSRILQKAGICESLWATPDALIPSASYRRALNVAADATGKTNFGLLFSQRQSLSRFGAIGYLVKHGQTVQEGLELFLEYFANHDTATLPNLSLYDDRAVIDVKLTSIAGESAIQQAEASIGLALRLFRELVSEDWSPIAVFFEHQKPKELKYYQRIFRCPVYFNQTQNAIEFQASDLMCRPKEFDPILFHIIHKYVQMSMRQDDSTLSRRVRAEILSKIEEGTLTLQDISDALDINRTRLQRTLKSEGTTYQEILEQTRFSLAQTYLKDTNMPLAEITSLLSYAEPAVFTRAFKRRAGVTPSQWRAQNN